MSECPTCGRQLRGSVCPYCDEEQADGGDVESTPVSGESMVAVFSSDHERQADHVMSLLESEGIRQDLRDVWRYLRCDGHLCLRRFRFHHTGALSDKFDQRDGLWRQLDHSNFRFCVVENVIDQIHQMPCSIIDVLEKISLNVSQWPRGLTKQCLIDGDDRG